MSVAVGTLTRLELRTRRLQILYLPRVLDSQSDASAARWPPVLTGRRRTELSSLTQDLHPRGHSRPPGEIGGVQRDRQRVGRVSLLRHRHQRDGRHPSLQGLALEGVDAVVWSGRSSRPPGRSCFHGIRQAPGIQDDDRSTLTPGYAVVHYLRRFSLRPGPSICPLACWQWNVSLVAALPVWLLSPVPHRCGQRSA